MLNRIVAYSLGGDSAHWSQVRQISGEVAKGGYQLATDEDSNASSAPYVDDPVEPAFLVAEVRYWPFYWHLHLGPKLAQHQSARPETSPTLTSSWVMRLN
jgi:hypothetical protein